MERFDAPDLTLTEAKDLRSRLAALLEPGRSSGDADGRRVGAAPTRAFGEDRGVG